MTHSCPHRPPCPGCPRFGERGIAAGSRALLQDLARSHGIPEVAEIAGRTDGFRHRARLAIRGRVGSPKLGLFELDSHRVVHIPRCSVQHPLINRVAEVVRRALVDARLTSYSDNAHLGLARYLQVVVERGSQRAQVVLVANSASADPLAGCLERIRAMLGEELHSLWLNANTTTGNTILGTDFQNWCGPETISDDFGGARVYYPPGAFGQSNPEIAQRIIGYVREQIPAGSRVAEFYAGVGAIGLSVLNGVSEMRMNELSPQSLRGLEIGIANLDTARRAKVSVVSASAGAARECALDVDVVIVDPPRKGLDSELTEYLVEHPPERLIYVSCSVDSLRRDAGLLTARHTLRLTALTAFNLIPFTEHVETVARFERVA